MTCFSFSINISYVSFQHQRLQLQHLSLKANLKRNIDNRYSHLFEVIENCLKQT